MVMKLSPKGLKFLEANEGVVLRVYPDTSEIPTCGVGHVVLPGDGLKLGDTITQAQCDAFLAHDVAKCEAAINGAVTVPMGQNQFDALVSLCFNIGVGDAKTGRGFLGSSVLRDLNTDNLADEKHAFELWDKDVQNGKLVVDERLLARRDREFALFMSPDPVPTDDRDAVAAAQGSVPLTGTDDDSQPTPPGDLPPAAS